MRGGRECGAGGSAGRSRGDFKIGFSKIGNVKSLDLAEVMVVEKMRSCVASEGDLSKRTKDR